MQADRTPTSATLISGNVRPSVGAVGVRCTARFAPEPYVAGRWPAQERRVRFVVGKICLFDGLDDGASASIAALLGALELDEADHEHLSRALAELG
jgi:hypothetical protein